MDNRREDARTRRSRERRLSVRSVRRDPVDTRKIARAIIAMALAEAEAEAAAAAKDEQMKTQTSKPDGLSQDNRTGGPA